MGSVTAVASTAGTVVERYSYTAFGQGQVMDASFADRSMSLYDWQTRFHGESRDEETGYYNYGYRYYDPKTGRWLSRDPIGERGGMNLYGFVGNDGVNLIDNLGLFDWEYQGEVGVAATLSPGPVFFALGGKVVSYEDVSGTCCKKINFSGSITWGGGVLIKYKVGLGGFGAKLHLGISGHLSIVRATHKVDFDIIYDCLHPINDSKTGKIDILDLALGFEGKLSGSIYLQAGSFKFGFQDAAVEVDLNGDIQVWADIDMDKRSADIRTQISAKFGAGVTWQGNTRYHNILGDLDTGSQDLHKITW
jgi:RHS repeat-associated protein